VKVRIDNNRMRKQKEKRRRSSGYGMNTKGVQLRAGKGQIGRGVSLEIQNERKLVA